MDLKLVENMRSLALVGATGLVGREFLELLTERKIKIPKIKLLASSASEGEVLQSMGDELPVEILDENSFEEIDVAFFSVPTSVCKKFIPHALSAGAIVIDDSSAFRMQDDVPLVVPQVNGAVLRGFESGIVAVPNCTTTPLAMCLKPIAEEYGLKRVVVSTYQAVSGAGKEAFEELTQQTKALMNGTSVEINAFPRRIAFNCLPKIGPMEENGDSEEEAKIGRELRKILELPNLKVTATAVRVPTFCGHALSVNVELEESFDSATEIRTLLEGFDGVKVLDKPEADIYPTIEDCVKSDFTLVGRIRRDSTVPSGLNLWVVADNLRKGAALNALECLSTLYGYRQLN